MHGIRSELILARVEAGRTQGQVAQASGVSQQLLSARERGKHPLPVEDVGAWAAAVDRVFLPYVVRSQDAELLEALFAALPHIPESHRGALLRDLNRYLPSDTAVGRGRRTG